MATLKIYSGSTGMQASLTQIEAKIAEELAAPASSIHPRDALGMLAAEEEHQARGRRLGDLFTLRDVLRAHMDLVFINESLQAGREHLHAQGARWIKSSGWTSTRIKLRGGLIVKLQSPYLRQDSEGRKKAKRGKTGTGLYPLLHALGFEDQFSPLGRSEVARQTVLCSSYEQAREQLEREGLRLDVSGITRIAVNAGRKALELRGRSVRAALEAPLPTYSSLQGRSVRVALDGGRARKREPLADAARPGKNKRRPFNLDWIEPRVLTIDILDEDGQVDRQVQPIYETTLSKAGWTMDLLAGTLRLLGVPRCFSSPMARNGSGAASRTFCSRRGSGSNGAKNNDLQGWMSWTPARWTFSGTAQKSSFEQYRPARLSIF